MLFMAIFISFKVRHSGVTAVASGDGAGLHNDQPAVNKLPTRHVRKRNIEFSNFVFTPQIPVARTADATRRTHRQRNNKMK